MSDFEDDTRDEMETQDDLDLAETDRFQKLGFRPQKELIWNKYLPYADKLDNESQEMLLDIKTNLAKAVAMRDINPGVGIYSSRLMVYIKLYGLKFSKEDHLKFIKLFLELIALPDLEPSKLNKFCILLIQLFKKTYNLSPDDLEIDWRPFYKLFYIYLHKTSSKGNFYQFFSKRKSEEKNSNQKPKLNLSSLFDQMFPLAKFLGGSLDFVNKIESELDNESLHCTLKTVIQHCSVYFPKTSTQEILDEVLPKLEPLDTGKSCQVFEIMSLFLNYYDGYELWFDDFMNLWNTYHNPPWSEDMMNIMGNLAFTNIGRINWEPHMPVMFARILRWLDLPVNYKHLKVARTQSLCTASVTKWVIAVLSPKTSGQKYLTQFIGAIETYLHPANSGKWIKMLGQILVGLTENFIKRLEYERFRKAPWKPEVPEEHKLTEDCITKFVESFKSAAFQMMYSRIDSNDVYKIFRNLSNLRPELIIPEVIERVYANLESLTEPHRLTASLQCLVGVSRALISGHNGYTAGRTHVIPILFATLPGIDPNDIRKVFFTLNFYGTFVFQIPIVDCSKAGIQFDDLTEEESLICEQTADFEDFVLQFIDRLFVMIKYTTQESVRMEQVNSDNSKSRYDTIVENSITSGLQVVLGQCSDEIVQAAARKITIFVQSNLLEPNAAAPLLGTLVNSIAQIAGSYMYKTLVPYLCERIIRYIKEHDDAVSIEKQPDDFLYYYTIFYYLFKSDPREIILYLDEYLIPTLDEVIRFKCKQTNKITSSLLFSVLVNFSRAQVFDFKNTEYNSKKPFTELPIRQWGRKMTPKEKINWFMPGIRERDAYEKIIHRYMPPILQDFEQYIKGEVTMERSEVYKNANYLLSMLSLATLIPEWDEPLKDLTTDSVVNSRPISITLGLEELPPVYMPDGSDIRRAVIHTIGRLQEKLLADSGDDIQSLKVIILIWDKVRMRRGFIHTYDGELKSFNHLKEFQQFSLVKKKRHIKSVVVKRVLIQQTCRDELAVPYFTETHKDIMLKLLTLSTSHYGAVRSQAQSKLLQFANTYPFSYRELLDSIVDVLKLDSNENHESFKGVLYLLIVSGRTKLLMKHDWLCIEKLWLNILKSKPSEKPSIVHLMDAIIYIMSDEFTTLTIEMNVPDNLVELALELLDKNNPEILISKDDIELGKKRLNEKNKMNRERYLRIVNSILEIAQRNSLHWRYHLMASTMVQILIHPTVKYPVGVAKYFIHNLVHESIKERKAANRIMNIVLIQQKRKHVRIKMDPFEIAGVKRPEEKLTFGLRDDNRWIQYDEKTLPKSQEDWDKPCYLHKAEGFFGWSSSFQIYAPSSQQPKIDRTREEMNEVEQIIYDFFIDPKNVDKFISLWSLEENKGKEKFKENRFGFIKYLFKIFGDVFYDNFHHHLERLIKQNKQESNHRCAAEILSGIMRGMKLWPFEKTKTMYGKITPLIRLALQNITVETDGFWGTCFATASEHFDPRKQYWLHEVLMEEPLRESTSFVDCCRIFCLQGPFNQHVWRMDSFAHRLLNYLRPFLNHSFQNVRIRLGSILINIFEADLQFKNGMRPECPRTKDMIEEVLEKLQPLYNEMPPINTEDESVEPSPEQKEYDDAVRLFKTITQWILGVISRNTNGNEEAYFDLLPFACKLETCEQDSELADISTTLLAIISQALTLPDRMGYGLNKIDEISRSSSWSSRLAVIDALQVLVFHNMAIVSSRDEWVQQVQDTVLRLLEDSSLEVREKAAQVLGGLLHCSFLPATDKLLEQFKKKCKTKFVRVGGSTRKLGMMVGDCGTEANKLNNGKSSYTVETPEAIAIRMRHTGVLGLCAFISAYPYDIPDFVPDVFEHLGAHLNDPQPIPSTIRKTVGDFKRTHHDNWATHQLKFTEDQLAVLSDLTIPPSYYT